MSLISANSLGELPFPAPGRHLVSWTKEGLHVHICSVTEALSLVTTPFSVILSTGGIDFQA